MNIISVSQIKADLSSTILDIKRSLNDDQFNHINSELINIENRVNHYTLEIFNQLKETHGWESESIVKNYYWGLELINLYNGITQAEMFKDRLKNIARRIFLICPELNNHYYKEIEPTLSFNPTLEELQLVHKKMEIYLYGAHSALKGIVIPKYIQSLNAILSDESYENKNIFFDLFNQLNNFKFDSDYKLNPVTITLDVINILQEIVRVANKEEKLLEDKNSAITVHLRAITSVNLLIDKSIQIINKKNWDNFY